LTWSAADALLAAVSLLRVLLMSVAPLALAGCLLVPRAMDRFERKLFCPRGRLVVRERTDLKAHDFACLERARDPDFSYDVAAADVDCSSPPPEIRADPGRLRFWQERRDRAFRKLDREVGSIVEVQGCGVRRFYVEDGELGSIDPKGGL
jgi:hypothetical protein